MSFIPGLALIVVIVVGGIVERFFNRTGVVIAVDEGGTRYQVIDEMVGSEYIIIKIGSEHKKVFKKAFTIRHV